MISIYIYSA